nr:peptide-methionine (R)-S-oxide reductase [Actinomycetota bacterium]
MTDEQFRELRRKSTERPFSGAHVHPPGSDGFYRCAGREAPLFAADAQFDSGTSWPSFTGMVADSVELRRDFSVAACRALRRCASVACHLGHLFKD